MADLIDRMNDVGNTIDKAISVASTKKEFIGKQLVNGFLLFIILLVFGCLDFVNMRFNFGLLFGFGTLTEAQKIAYEVTVFNYHKVQLMVTGQFWTASLTKTIAGICAYNIGINLMFEVELKRDYILGEAIKLYNQLIAYKQVDFEYFVIKIFNPQEKKKAYISQINRKIYLLNKFSRAKDRLLYSSEIEEKQPLKLKNRYCRRRKELEDLKKDEFIDKNLDGLKVNYYEVDPSVFELEIDGGVSVKGYRVKGSVKSAKVKATSSMALGMIAISMLTASIFMDPDTAEAIKNVKDFMKYAIKCATDIGIVLWQVLRGMFKTRKIVSSEYTNPYVNRNKVLKDYINWRLDTNQPTSKVDEMLKSTEEIELTEEQIKELGIK